MCAAGNRHWVVMKISTKTKQLSLGCLRPVALAVGLFVGMAPHLLAAELGKATGTPVLGRELDVTIPVTLDAPADEPCADVQAYFGETRAKTLDIWIESANPQSGRIRVVSTHPVDEPVVSVYVNIKCGGQVSRKYVFLTELVMDAAAVPLVLPSSPVGSEADRARTQAGAPAGGAATQTPLAVSSSPAVAVARRSVKPKAAATMASSEGAGSASTSAVTKPVSKGAGKPVVASSSAAPKEDANAKSRLKLEPLSMLEPPSPALKVSEEMLAMTAASSPDRQAAAAMWKSLSASPEELVADKAKLRNLETQLGDIQSRFVAQQEMMQKLQADVSAQRTQNWVLMGLLLLMGGVAFFLYRNGKSRQAAEATGWWNNQAAGPRNDEGPVSELSRPADVPASVAPVLAPVAPQPLTSVDAPAVKQELSSAAALTAAFPAQIAKPTDSYFAPLSNKSYDVQELFDVQEQAEFFSSVGQYHRAVDVLKDHVRQNPEGSALSYLDLFALYHRLNRKKDYEELTAKFNEQFSVEVPPFEEFGTATVKHLDDYPSAMDSIAGLWPDEEAMDVIAELIFTKPKEDQVAFSLEAYRELLMLYAILRDVREGLVSDEPFHSAAVESEDFKPDEQPLDFWADVDENAIDNRQVSDLYKPKASNKLGLDIDLSKNDKA